MDDVTYELVSNLFGTVSAVVAIVSVLTLTYSALRSGLIRQLSLGEFSIEITPKEVLDASKSSGDGERFEASALANYYNQALARTNISFWFSLIFASIGFGVIIVAFLTHNPADHAGSIIKVVSGVIIDAVAGLFFVQSNSSQQAMVTFFEKLRMDRANAEARGIIGEIKDVERADQLRAQLVLKYAGIEKLLTSTSELASSNNPLMQNGTG